MEENYISGWKIFSWKKKYLAENFFIRWENIWCETNLAGGDFWRKVREYKSLAHPLPAKAQTFNWWWWWWLVMVIIILCWQFIPLQELAAMAQTLIFHSSAFLLICRLSNYLFFISKKSLLMVKYPLLLAHDTKSCYRQRQPRIQTWSWPWRGSLDDKVARFALNQNTNTRLSDSDTFISNINTRIWRWPAFFHTCIKEIIPLRPGRESLTREQAGVSPTLTKKTWRSRSPTIGIKSPANIIGINQSRTIGMG